MFLLPLNFFICHLLKTKKKRRETKVSHQKQKKTTTSTHTPALPQTPATSLTPRRRFLHELNELTRHHQTSANYRNVRDFGKNRDFWKNDDRECLFFFTYARCRRRLPLIKMNNEGEKVFVLPFSTLDDEYLFWKYRLTRFKSEVIYSGKDSIGLLAHDKKKDGKPKISGEKMFQQKCLGFLNIRV